MDHSFHWRPFMDRVRSLSSRLALQNKAGVACTVTLYPHYVALRRSLGRVFSWAVLLVVVGNLASGWGYATLAGVRYAWGASWLGVVLGVIVAHPTALDMLRSTMFGVALSTALGVALSTVGGVTEGIALGIALGTVLGVVGGTAPAVLLVGTALAVARGMGEGIAAGVAFGVAWGSSYGVTVALCLWHSVKEHSVLTRGLHG